MHHQPSQPFRQRGGRLLSVMLHHSVALHAQVTLFRWSNTLAVFCCISKVLGYRGERVCVLERERERERERDRERERERERERALSTSLSSRWTGEGESLPPLCSSPPACFHTKRNRSFGGFHTWFLFLFTLIAVKWIYGCCLMTKLSSSQFHTWTLWPFCCHSLIQSVFSC